jgi:hypothetical protein
MELSTVNGITTKRVFIENIDLNTLTDKLSKKLSSANNINSSRLKTIKATSDRYCRVDSTMPAVAFVNFSTKNGDIFLTNSIPPKYIKSFWCKRIADSVGEFSLSLQSPIDTFKPGTEDLTIKLINLLGHIDADFDGTDVKGYKCELSYGWRGSKRNSVITYKEALITGLTVDYAGNHYTYTIKGLLSEQSEESYETDIKILSRDALTTIDTSNMSEESKSLYDAHVAARDVATLLDASVGTAVAYRLKVPKDSKIYTIDTTKNVTETSRTLTSDLYFIYSNRQNNTVAWTSDYKYCYNAPRGSFTSLDCYAVEDILMAEYTGEVVPFEDAEVDNEFSVVPGLDLTTVEAGHRISETIEILANYIFGKQYNVKVSHADKIYDERTTIPTTLTSVDDTPSYAQNETTTSLHTWLMHMIGACTDNREATTYEKYAKYDTNNDGVLIADDFTNFSTINTSDILAKWKKHGIDTYTYTYDHDGKKVTNASESAFGPNMMSEADFIKKHNLASYQKQYPEGFIGPKEPEELKAKKWLTYEDYKADYEAYQNAVAFSNDSAELNTLLETFNGAIFKGADSIQYHLYYSDAIAGETKGTIYIGPPRDDTEKHQYIVGNKLKDSVVQSFSTSEDLVYLLAMVKSYISAANSGLYQVDPNTGGIVKGLVDTSSERIDTKELYATTVANKILTTMTEGQHTADLTVLSDYTSRRVHVADNITVLCQNNGGKSMFSGTYYVVGVKDDIDENGRMTTSFTLHFIKSSAFTAVRDIILQHLNNVTLIN